MPIYTENPDKSMFRCRQFICGFVSWECKNHKRSWCNLTKWDYNDLGPIIS